MDSRKKCPVGCTCKRHTNSGSKPCPVGCSCPRHLPKSEETKKRISDTLTGTKAGPCSPEKRAKISATQKGYQNRLGIPTSPEGRKNISNSLMGNTNALGAVRSVATRAKLAESKNTPEAKAHSRKIALHSWRGGKTGDAFATVLCPAGFIREHQVFYGDRVQKVGHGLRRKKFQLDFAHVEGKIDIELDGPTHWATKKHDAERDTILRALGWKIIRINHE
jgi:hypothetical protein